MRTQRSHVADTAQRAERYQSHHTQATQQWNLRESELRAEMAAAAAEYEARIEKLQRDFDFMHDIAKKGGAPRMMQSVKRGCSIRAEMRQKKAAATSIQTKWRGKHERSKLAELHAAALYVQKAYRSMKARRRLQRAIRDAQEERLRNVLQRGERSTIYW